MDNGEGSADLPERVARQVPGWEDRPLVIEPAIPILASPSWRGVDGEPILVRDTETEATLFVKRMHPDTTFYVDVAAAFDAATKAGEAGVGPRVLKSDVSSGVLVMEDLSQSYRVAGLEHAYDSAFIDKVMEKRSAFARVAPLARKADVFADIERFQAMVKEKGAPVPSDTDWLVEALRLAAEAVGEAGPTPVPVHGDGNVSNILVNAEGDVRLVDFDLAGNGDPMEDMGSFLVEAFAFEAEARDAFYRYAGKADEPAFNRARAFGVADDLRWGLIGALQAHLSPRKTNEFYKFSNWRFLRCRMAVRDPRFGERLRRVA